MEHIQVVDDEVVIPEFDMIAKNYEQFKKQLLHSTQVHRNQLSVLTRTVNYIEHNTELKITTAIAEYDKGVMENFKICTDAVNKVIAEYEC